MREGKLYINNLDAYATYGVFLANDRGRMTISPR